MRSHFTSSVLFNLYRLHSFWDCGITLQSHHDVRIIMTTTIVLYLKKSIHQLGNTRLVKWIHVSFVGEIMHWSFGILCYGV